MPKEPIDAWSRDELDKARLSQPALVAAIELRDVIIAGLEARIDKLWKRYDMEGDEDLENTVARIHAVAVAGKILLDGVKPLLYRAALVIERADGKSGLYIEIQLTLERLNALRKAMSGDKANG